MNKLEAPSGNGEAGSTTIELLMASLILLIISLGILPLMSVATATNHRNRVDTTGSLLANAIVEHMRSTIVGSETSSLTDCGGNVWTVNTAPGGSNVAGDGIDFTQTNPPVNYHMNYAIQSPCGIDGKEQDVYDVRWRVEIVGAPASPTNTYLVTVGVRQGRGQANLVVSKPFNLRVMIGN